MAAPGTRPGMRSGPKAGPGRCPCLVCSGLRRWRCRGLRWATVRRGCAAVTAPRRLPPRPQGHAADHRGAGRCRAADLLHSGADLRLGRAEASGLAAHW
eukprot:scaffold71843_cov60-Phaeocystis_antarctica.AAC.1